jgi:hypothetical protein
LAALALCARDALSAIEGEPQADAVAGAVALSPAVPLELPDALI